MAAFFILSMMTFGGIAAYDAYEAKSAATTLAKSSPKVDQFSVTVPHGNPTTFGPADVGHVKAELIRREVGQTLLKSTHPTGSFTSASEPVLSVLGEGRLKGQVTVKWSGVSYTGYKTTFGFSIGNGRAQVQIIEDTASFKSNALGIAKAEDALTRMSDDIYPSLPSRQALPPPSTKTPPTLTHAEQEKLVKDLQKTVQDVQTAVANHHLGERKYDLAIEEFDKMLQANPRDVLALNGRGFAYAQKGDLPKAFADLDESTRLGPNSAATYRLRGRALSSQKEWRAAVAEYTEAIRLDPKADVGLSWVRRSGFSTYLERGFARLKLEDFDEAVDDLTQEIRLQPESAGSYELRATAYEKAGNVAAAEADRAKATALKSKQSKP